MNDFQFDPKHSSQDNISNFINHLETINPEMTKIFKKHIDMLVPLPEGNQRGLKRKAFNDAVLKSLQELKDTNEKEELND